MLVNAALGAFLIFSPAVFARELSALQRRVHEHRLLSERATYSLNVSSCPGYKLGALTKTSSGISAQLTLVGAECNAFGTDTKDLTIEVNYETQSRLHVNIYDTSKTAFTVPTDLVAPPGTKGSFASSSDLVFNYNSSPFAFWITRRADPKATPIFDTRISSLPKTPIPPFTPLDNSTALDGFPLVFEDQYVQIASALTKDANIYGLGEVIASAGFRRDVGTSGGGSIQTNWARDVGDPIDQNEYGIHPFYIEHRTGTPSTAHGVFLNSAQGADILLTTPTGASKALIEYRMLGGTLDFYFFSGPSAQAVAEQYAEVVGTPLWQPLWGFGYHQCRWGYSNVSETMAVVKRMKAAGIPLETMWNDIDLYHAVRDFTSDPVSFPGDDMRSFIASLHANNQHYIPIVDAAVAVQVNKTDTYYPYLKGKAQDVFMKNPDGSEYVGQVWPGYTVFPDWFAPNTQAWWTEALANWTAEGVTFDGIWLDMNEASSFCDGSCGTGADLSNTSVPFFLPGTPGNLVTGYPECYNSTIYGTSGNITVNGTATCQSAITGSGLSRRGLGAGAHPGIDVNAPPYTINNGNGRLSLHALATNATHHGGYLELDTHNLWGTMEEKATHTALRNVRPGQRPFLISRSTYSGAGKFTGHWLGDNTSLWLYLKAMIQGVLQFQIFQIPMVGADTCGFNGNTDEELCNRWMQAAAFTPFYRNHNVKGAISQEPYVWDSVRDATIMATNARYAMLPYWYSLFANASLKGTPPVRALWMEFPEEPELLDNDRQWLIGHSVLVTPVLLPNATTVDGMFPGRGSVVWRDWWTHNVVDAAVGANTTLQAPLGHINVHIRSGSAMLLFSTPAYTVEETRQGGYSLLVSLASDGYAFGQAYIDDGESYPVSASKTLTFKVKGGKLTMTSKGSYTIQSHLNEVTILGVENKPSKVLVAGKVVSGGWNYTTPQEKLVISGLNLDPNGGVSVEWT